MFTDILIPLDGSRLAEWVLPAGVFLAKTLHASVTLVHVIEKNAPKEIHGETHLRDPEEASKYLERIAKEVFSEGIKTECHVHETEVENVARSISDHVGELGSDLIIMCTHGRSGMRDFLFGNIAQQVIGMGKTPILLMHPGKNTEEYAFSCKRLLIPMDGHPEHEQAIEKIKPLAKNCNAGIHLATVVPKKEDLPGKLTAIRRMLPVSMSRMLDMEVQTAKEYLERMVENLIKDGITATSEVLRGDPATLIVESAKQNKTDIIILGTHARHHMDAFWSESVAPRISNNCEVPLLLVPVSHAKE